jgi:asparagine synthase (glutamine-hydrolysing)
MVQELGTDHTEVAVSRADIAAVFPEVIRHVERPLLRAAPAPMLLLARRVRDAGLKVVLTGEGADEMLAGYDLFREARVRRSSAREPRPDAPEFAHGPRWRAAAALQRLLHPEVRDEAARAGDPVARLVATLPAAFATWDPLARDQYLEIRTLLSGYLLASQGDRVAMASSVESRFPFLDPEVVELAASLPAGYKLRVLDEKHVLKRAATGLVPQSILARPKQPYRAPDAAAFCGDLAPGWIAEVLDPAAIRAAGMFEPAAVALLWATCRERRGADLSNADTMALTAVLSTQLLHRELISPKEDPSDARR